MIHNEVNQHLRNYKFQTCRMCLKYLCIVLFSPRLQSSMSLALFSSQENLRNRYRGIRSLGVYLGIVLENGFLFFKLKNMFDKFLTEKGFLKICLGCFLEQI